MALLASAALGATVVTSQRALSSASDVVVRGEGDLVLAALVADLDAEASPATPAALGRALEANAGAGLRYVAIVDRSGATIAEAGHAVMERAAQRPGDTRIEGRRVRVTGPLYPPRRRPRAERERTPEERALGPARIVAELEPPVIETLRSDLTRIGVVATAAAGVLLAFAIAWSRSARRLAELEARAAREERLVALGSMSSVMAHELRNPLASLKGHAQLLAEDLDGALDAKKRAKADRVVLEAERLERLTTTLLDFVRDGPIEERPVPPRELADRSLDDLPKERVKVELDGAPPAIAADLGRLSRAVHNLVDNALKAAENEPAILRIAAEGRDVVVTVRDRGPGLPPGAEAKIFEPFTTTRVRGTGLGLAVARRIAEQHDGTLVGENHPDGGAIFTMRLRGRGA
jgi:two-component system sensor histidine kinase HydH